MESWALLPIGIYIAAKLLSFKLHQSLLARVPIRIHVNGTRGKSQTTELLTCGLRAAGIRTMGKVSGSVPSLIHIDGTRSVIGRLLPASISEQGRVVRRAVREGAQALVIECMAVRPELQWASEHRMIRSQIGVITNVRVDHTDILGSSAEETALALAGTIPFHGILFTTEDEYLDLLTEEAQKRSTRIVSVSACAGIDPELRQRIPLHIHPENLALALAVCEQIGIAYETALSAMLNLEIREGDLDILRVISEEQGKSVLFVNAFSGNDPLSTKIMLEKVQAFLKSGCGNSGRDAAGKSGGVGLKSGNQPGISPANRIRPLVGLFNHRRVRSFRARLFSEFAENVNFDRLYLAGDRLSHWQRYFPNAAYLPQIGPSSLLWDRILTEIENDSVIFGFGNFAGAASELSDYIHKIGDRI